ncbi:unnamed protein product [Darwinula stevensoni]|uniref:Uncharacterized protein n=1 Tax=Darwinula stevensoni TaxID=69355 RepID=A0A7R8XL11_9CRUS|nr:unnamed protein product [Darwinula stevensoni]CAG0893722.1 unnamed protein product [Darwinula stevensoni]
MAEVPNDTRPEFISDYLQKTLRLKPDRWTKFIASEDNKKIIQEFLDKDYPDLIVITQNAAGQLGIALAFPIGSKSKSVYFMKKSRGAVPRDKIKQALVFGDMSPVPLDQLCILIDEVPFICGFLDGVRVLIPLLSNKGNLETWPQPIRDDICNQIQELKGTNRRVTGQTKGRAVLPLPLETEEIDAAERIAQTESVFPSFSLDGGEMGKIHRFVSRFHFPSDDALADKI